MGRQEKESAYVEQREESHPGQDEAEQDEISSEKAHNLKLMDF